LGGFSSGCSEKAGKSSRKENTPYTQKVSSSIRNVVEQMISDGVDLESSEGGATDLSESYSTSIVKVDDEGRVQCYIALDPFEKEYIDSLRTFSVLIEREEATLRLVQAWIPFDRIRSLSGISFITGVRPPEYPAPR